MADTERLRIAMEKLHAEGVPAADITRRLGIAKSTVYSNLNRLKETGTMEDGPRSERPKIASTSEIVKEFERRSTHEDPRESLLVTKEHPKGAAIDERQQARCGTLMKRFGSSWHRRILFTDEFVFTIEQFFNHQNDRILGKDIDEANQNG
ncbi:unnamed protein product [Heligmosomoides polygyrus]|uniref:HTH_11 domain-containing protein n=1 Tax=Heligmosomoides polygyrus TaxID=6339 RepID=A0A183GDX3_HELPZ|nr:unnamed protein product [Heligmosomoides polygyrus]